MHVGVPNAGRWSLDIHSLGLRRRGLPRRNNAPESPKSHGPGRRGLRIAPVPVATERGLAQARLAVAAAFAVVLPLHRPALPVVAVLAVLLLAVSGAVTLRPDLAARLPQALGRSDVLYALEALAACALAAAYPTPDLFSWLGFVLLIVSGAARWTLNGATFGYSLYTTVEMLALRATGNHLTLTGAEGIRIGVIGLTSVVVGMLARSVAQFRALQARTDALADSQQALRSIIDTSPDAVVTVDAGGVITNWSRRAEQLFQYTAEEVVGRHVDEVMVRSLDDQPWQPTESTGGPAESLFRRRDGSQLPVDLVVSAPLRMGGEVRHAVFVSDISVRKRIDLRKELQTSVVRVFAESPSLHIGVERFLQVMCEGLGWQGANLWRVDPEESVLRPMNAWYSPELSVPRLAKLNRGLCYQRGELLPGRAWQRNTTVTVCFSDLESTPRRVALLRAGLAHGVALPIVTDSGVIGVAEFFSRTPIAIDDMADTMASIGAHAGLFIERRREEAAHRDTALRLQSLLDSVGDGIITFDVEGAIESANRAAGQLFGCPAEQVTQITVDMLLAADQRGRLAARLQRGAMEWETEGLRRDGSAFPMEFRAAEMQLGDKRLYIATLRDTSELKARTLALQHQALHDNLTGLPNRTLLTDRLGQAISVAHRAGHPVSLLLMDMDGFKEVNDSMGHHCGDILLRQLAERLRSTLRAEDTVARLGGDEFAVLPAGACDEAAAMRIADKVLAALQTPFLIEEQAIHARMSIGVAVYPAHGEDADILMRRADVAMYTAKRMRSGQVIYSPAQDEHSKRRLQITGELRRAIPASELVLHYQPRLHLPTGTVTALEALVRWQHPVQGLVPPADFIPVAEQSDLIHPLTAWVAGEAVRQLRVFSELGLDLSIAINVSARNLADQQLPLMMAGLLRQWGVGASQLRLEMTESVVMASDWQEVLAQLHELGLSVAIDDFGVGYSSLAYLQRLPVDEIKIDKSFVGDMVDNADNAAIVRSTIDLGHNLGLKVVAEGVETAECLAMLASFGCDAAQGFLVSPPLTASELITFFAENGADAFAYARTA